MLYSTTGPQLWTWFSFCYHYCCHHPSLKWNVTISSLGTRINIRTGNLVHTENQRTTHLCPANHQPLKAIQRNCGMQLAPAAVPHLLQGEHLQHPPYQSEKTKRSYSNKVIKLRSGKVDSISEWSIWTNVQIILRQQRKSLKILLAELLLPVPLPEALWFVVTAYLYWKRIKSSMQITPCPSHTHTFNQTHE